ncbi:hypothetical protein McpSp1_14320 [Methanocorpusculaceae archaeon Sp1]|nr:hypothetical protein [Methanocorpusculaceae archaeon Sp1]
MRWVLSRASTLITYPLAFFFVLFCVSKNFTSDPLFTMLPSHNDDTIHIHRINTAADTIVSGTPTLKYCQKVIVWPRFSAF